MYYYVIMSRTQTRSIGIAVIAAALAAGAAAFAASRSAGTEKADPATLGTEAVPRPDAVPDSVAERAALENPIGPVRHPRFFDMYYVFTATAPVRVDAYPLANPPGIVIDLEGVPEPEEPAAALVGQDDRIRSVRRRVTDRGLRYIIAIDTPVARVEVEHEGEVVIVTPIR